MPPAPQSFPREPTRVKSSIFKIYSWTTLAASAFPIALVCALFWIVENVRIPTGEDAERAYKFRAALVHRLEPSRLENLNEILKIKPLPGGRGMIVFQQPAGYSKEQLLVIQKEFDQLNTEGAFVLVLPDH